MSETGFQPEDDDLMMTDHSSTKRKRAGWWCSLFIPEEMVCSIVSSCKGKCRKQDRFQTMLKRVKLEGGTNKESQDSSMESSFTIDDEEIQKARVDWFDAHQMANSMATSVQRTLETDKMVLWEKFPLIVTLVKKEGCKTLDGEKCVGLAFAFQEWASTLLEYKSVGNPLTDVSRLILSLQEALGKLVAMEDEDMLRKDLASLIIEAGLFVRALTETKRVHEILGHKPTHIVLKEFEHKLLEFYTTVYLRGIIGYGISTIKTSEDTKVAKLPFSENLNLEGHKGVLEEIGLGFHQERLTAVTKTVKLFEGGIVGPSSEVKLLEVIGLSGSGKSQIALAFAYQSRANYENIIWLDAGSLCLREHFASYDLFLGMQPEEEERIEERVEKVRRVLEDGKRYLLILDNVQNEKLLEPVLPKLGSAHVIMTSENPLERVSLTLSVNSLPLENALEILQQGYRQKEDEARLLVEIARDLKCLPFALVIASKMLVEVGIPPSKLLTLMRKNILEETEAGFIDWSFQSPSSMKGLLEEAIQAVAGDGHEDGKAAIALVEAGGWLGGQGVPVAMLAGAARRLRGLDPNEIDDSERAIARLLKLQLVQREKNQNLIVFHPLLQNFSRARDFGGAAAVAVLKTIANTRCSIETVDHFVAVWERKEELVKTHPIVLGKVLEVGLSMVRFTVDVWKQEEVLEICHQVLDMGPIIGDIRLYFWQLKVEIIGKGGDKILAAQEGRQCLEAMDENLANGPLGLATWATVLINEVEGGLKTLEDAVDECDLFEEEALELAATIRDRDVTGPQGEFQAVDRDGLLVLSALKSIGKVYSQIPSLSSQAMSHDHVVLKLQEKILPETDWDVSETRWGLTFQYALLEDVCFHLQIVIESFQMASGIFSEEFFFGRVPEVSEMIATWQNVSNPSLGGLSFDGNVRGESEQVFKKAMGVILKRQSKPLPLKEQLRLAIYGVMDVLTRQSGKEKRKLEEVAMKRLERAIEMVRKSGMKCGKSFQVAIWKLGRLYDSVGKLEESEKQIEEWMLLDLEKRNENQNVLEEKKIRSTGRSVTMACVLIRRGKLGEADKILEGREKILECYKEDRSSERAHVLALRGSIMWLVGKVEDANIFLDRAKNLLKNLQALFPLQLASVLDALGKVASYKGDHIRAFESWRQALELREEVVGAKNPSLSLSLVHMASIEKQLGRIHAARELRDRALKLIKNSVEPDLIRLKHYIFKNLSDKTLNPSTETVSVERRSGRSNLAPIVEGMGQYENSRH